MLQKCIPPPDFFPCPIGGITDSGSGSTPPAPKLHKPGQQKLSDAIHHTCKNQKKHADHFVLCEHMIYLALFLCSAMVLAPETNNVEWEDNHLQLSVVIIPLRLCETTGSQCRQSVLDH